jgi:hypothetical protein
MAALAAGGWSIARAEEGQQPDKTQPETGTVNVIIRTEANAGKEPDVRAVAPRPAGQKAPVRGSVSFAKPYMDVVAPWVWRKVHGMEPGKRGGKVTYLGVTTSRVGETLARQLRLPDGVGLVVDHADANSPAAAAGLRMHDILYKLDDQVLVNQDQLGVLVRMHKMGDEVKLTVIREGKETVVPAKLSETEQTADMMYDLDVDFRYFDAKDRLLGTGGESVGVRPPNVAVTVPSFSFGRAGVSQSAMSDGQHILTIVTTDAGKVLTAKDKDGKVLFEGPIQTEEQRKKIPEEILKKVGMMERDIKFAPPAPVPDSN